MTIISTLPVAPSRADPATFADRGDALFGALAGFVSQTNAVATETNAAALQAINKAAEALSSAIAAVLSQTNARQSELNAAAFANQSAATFTQGAIALLPKVISASQSIPSGFNAISVGEISIPDGITVSVAVGSTWSIQ